MDSTASNSPALLGSWDPQSKPDTVTGPLGTSGVYGRPADLDRLPGRCKASLARLEQVPSPPSWPW